MTVSPETVAVSLEKCGLNVAAEQMRGLALENESLKERLAIAIHGLELARLAGGAHHANEALKLIREKDQ